MVSRAVASNGRSSRKQQPVSAEEGGLVLLHQLVPFGVGDPGDRGAGGDGRVVDQHVDGAERLLRLAAQVSDLCQGGLVGSDANGLSAIRTPGQVLALAYAASNAAQGGFFPQGVNGTINMSATPA